jgi:hypothetical protein
MADLPRPAALCGANVANLHSIVQSDFADCGLLLHPRYTQSNRANCFDSGRALRYCWDRHRVSFSHQFGQGNESSTLDLGGGRGGARILGAWVGWLGTRPPSDPAHAGSIAEWICLGVPIFWYVLGQYESVRKGVQVTGWVAFLVCLGAYIGCLRYNGVPQASFWMLEWAVAATLVISILVLFVAASISVATYPFNPRPVINAVLMVLFLTIGFVIVLIYSQMHRDAILSYVTDTNPGELGADF